MMTDIKITRPAGPTGTVEVAVDVVGGTTFMSLINALRSGGRYSSSAAIIVPPGTMGRIVSLVEQGVLKPLLANSFPLAELGKVQEAFLTKK
jgi:NADPH:quinone reductase-like Zn-dependent oxidoreductase